MAGYRFEYFNSSWLPLAARLGSEGDTDTYNQEREIIGYLQNTTANRAIAAAKPLVRAKFGGAVKYVGVLLRINLTPTQIRFKIVSQAYYAAHGEPFTYNAAGAGEQADTLFNAICTACGLVAGACPSTVIYKQFDKTDSWEALKFIALATGKAIIEDGLNISIGTKGTQRSYTGAYGKGSNRKTDPLTVYTHIYTRGKTLDGTIIYGEAGTTGKTRIIDCPNVTDTATLNTLAAEALTESKESVAVPLRIHPVDVCIDWVSGDTLPVTLSWADLDDTYTIMRITRHATYAIVEVDAALPTVEDLLRDFGDLAGMGILPPTPVSASDTIRHPNAGAQSTDNLSEYVKLKEIRVGKRFVGTIRFMFAFNHNKTGWNGSHVSVRKNGVELGNYGGLLGSGSQYFDLSDLPENTTIELWGKADDIGWGIILYLSDFDVGYNPDYANLYFVNQDPADFIGPQGPQGETGETGETGPQGPQGEQGPAGDYTSHIFKRNATQPSTPTGDTPSGWTDAPPVADGNPLWVSVGTFTGGHINGNGWSAPVQLEGGQFNAVYSIDGSTNWHTPFVAGDLYMMVQMALGGALEGPFRIVGEQGATGPQGDTGETGANGTDGGYVDYVFKRAATQPVAPSGDGTPPTGWYDAPPAYDGNPLWVSTAFRLADDSVVGSWATPVQITGDTGATGAAGDSVSLEYSVNGATNWHSTFTAGDLYAHTKIGSGSWSDAYRIVGEKGDTGNTGPTGPTGDTGPTGPAGTNGNMKQHIFIRSATQPSTPSGNGVPSGWSDGPPTGTATIWMSVAGQSYAGVTDGNGWSTPISLATFDAEYSVDGSTSWHSTFTAGDLFMRVRQPNGDWGTPLRIVAEQSGTYVASDNVRHNNADTVAGNLPTSPAIVKQSTINETVSGSIQVKVTALFGWGTANFAFYRNSTLLASGSDGSGVMSADITDITAGDTITLKAWTTGTGYGGGEDLQFCYDPDISLNITDNW